MENHSDLLEKVGQLGFPLLKTESRDDPNKILADVVKSRDPRLWEGFPVMLAHAGENNNLDVHQMLSLMNNQNERETMRRLVFMSIALYKILGLIFFWTKKLIKNYPPLSVRNEYQAYLAKFEAGYDFNIDTFRLSSDKIKKIFQSYYEGNRKTTSDLIQTREDMGLDYALSQIFSAKQKEIVYKKLRREILTKTEKEYFSRLVKKKLLAISNAELQRLVRQIVG